ncbi:MAG: SusC/RagA family TonB-linked outer membrane protein [Bacteroides sp.]|nr:SusC/RagA family TonB-linked outer membrane protein [Bacteroides sp.]
MNKRYILTMLWGTFLAGATAVAQDVVPETDSLVNIGYRRQVSAQVNPYASATVGSDVLVKSPEIDVKKALYGKLRGLHVEQGTGSSAYNEATLSLYGNEPLVLIDGFVRNLSDITSEEIESISVLTDAASCALYGMRGANGVVLVNTKRGQSGKLKVTAQYTFGLNTQFRSPEFADSYTYATALNQAYENEGSTVPYNSLELEAFRTGQYPTEFPDVNWWDEVYQNPGNTHRLDLTFNGGSDRFRYYTVVGYYFDKAMLTYNINDSRYDSKTKDVRLNVRTNLDADLTPTTKMRFNLMGQLKEQNGPNYDSDTFFSNLYMIPAAAFPILHSDGTYGGNSIYLANNPIAVLRDSGHCRTSYGTLYADLSLEQDLSAITEGLSASLAVSFDNRGSMYEKSSKTYAYKWHDASIDSSTGSMVYTPTQWSSNSPTLTLTDQEFESLYIEANFQGKIAYDRTFGKHHVGGAAIYDQYSYTLNGQNNSQKRQSAMLNATYTYDNRYTASVVANYSGSSYLPEGDRFTLYPAVSAAWIASNEAFMKDVKFIDYLRLHASFGLSGWDGNLSHDLWRSSYSTGGSYYFITNGTASTSYSETTPLAVTGLTAEKSRRATFGVDLSMFSNRLDISAEGFFEKRSNILVSNETRVTGIMGITPGQTNAGIYKYRGAALSLSWNDQINDFKYGVSANLTYMTSEVVNENQAYQQYSYLDHTGNKVNQCYGLEAIGFFNDQLEINNSATQTFSTVLPGDVKYKDQNGDGKIDSQDIVKMCGSSTPEVWFGFSLYASYKGFDISADFSGVTGVTLNLLDSPLYTPLINNGTISNTFLEREIPWTTDTKTTATMPRLSSQSNANNYQNSSLWYRDASFIKLRNLQIGYTFPKSMLRFADMRVYLMGTNLFSLDNVGFADPEQLVAAYPSIRSFWAGVKFNF